MVEIELELGKTLEKNAEIYFNKSKKVKQKLEGAKEALKNTKSKLKKALKILDQENIKKNELKKQQELDEAYKQETKTKEKWYHKFRWFITSDGLLVVGGRDATQNEILIKKQTEDHDIVLHTDMAGSPFFIIKSEGKDIPMNSIKQAATAVCNYSKAWKLGMATIEVFYVKPEQVTKEANQGEYLKKGSFMIRGKTKYVENKIDLHIGLTDDGMLMAGPEDALKVHCKKRINIVPGRKKTSECAKKIMAKLFQKNASKAILDDIIKLIPAGGCDIG